MAPPATGGIPPTAPSLGPTAAGLGNRSALGNGELLQVLSSYGLQTTTLTTKTDGNDGKAEHLEYIAFALVPVFFIMGLLGILICHVLKKKGYRCTTEAEEVEEEEKVDEKIEMNETIHENSDTVGQIVNYIMKNEANADVLKAMVADSSVFEPESPLSPTSPGSPVSPGSPLSPGAVPFKHSCKGHHFHTVGGVIEKDVCTRCSHKRWHLIKPAHKSKEHRRSRLGEVTVLSVGRFRVTKVEHKSNSKERKSLMSVSGVESVNGDMPVTPTKQEDSETPATLGKPEAQERRSSE
ncbi:RELT-like protein 1 isoform X1 [Larus michahellis]|uniref:RELT-like protein 1 isoform X1 n=1 Tax=Larus michahellis TaxID=119627 RepID=UPI003D9BA307